MERRCHAEVKLQRGFKCSFLQMNATDGGNLPLARLCQVTRRADRPKSGITCTTTGFFIDGSGIRLYFKGMKQEAGMPALAGHIESLPASIRAMIDYWIDAVAAYGAGASFWQGDAGQMF
jgi:hypothetical protein